MVDRETSKIKIDPSSQFLSWREITLALSTPNPINKEKLDLKLVDTVFLELTPQNNVSLDNDEEKTDSSTPHPRNSKKSCIRVTDWIFTSKNGQPTQRKNTSSLTIQHVSDRFIRFALANPANASGPRIVAVGFNTASTNERDERGERIHLTADQFQREAKKCENFYGENNMKSNKFPSIATFSEIQSYLRPYNGHDQIFRGVVATECNESIQTENLKKGQTKIHQTNCAHQFKTSKCEIFTLEGAISPCGNDLRARPLTPSKNSFLEMVRKGVEDLTCSIINHLQTLHHSGSQNSHDEHSHAYDCKRKLIRIAADFVLDDNKQLWLIHVSNIRLNGAEENTTKFKFNCDNLKYNLTSDQSNKSNNDHLYQLLPRINQMNTLEDTNSRNERDVTYDKGRSIILQSSYNIKRRKDYNMMYCILLLSKNDNFASLNISIKS